MDINKIIKEHRLLIVLGILALSVLAIKLSLDNGQRTEVNFTPDSSGFSTGETNLFQTGGLRTLPFDGRGVNTDSIE